MSLIDTIFRAVGSLGLIGPHAGHEAELLHSGSKPLGMIGWRDRPRSELTPDEHVAIQDVQKLDNAVTDGRLSKVAVYRPPQSSQFGREAELVHFYCQRGYEDQLCQVVNFHVAMWNGSEPTANLSENFGKLLGYTEQDIRLFNAGGYDALPLLAGWFMKTSHSLRKKARLKSTLRRYEEHPDPS